MKRIYHVPVKVTHLHDLLETLNIAWWLLQIHKSANIQTVSALQIFNNIFMQITWSPELDQVWNSDGLTHWDPYGVTPGGSGLGCIAHSVHYNLNLTL